MDAHVTQANGHESEAEQVARLRLPNHVREQPQVVREEQERAVVYDFVQVGLPRLEGHVPQDEHRGGERSEVQQGDLDPEVVVC